VVPRASRGVDDVLRRFFATQADVRFAYVFGSQARGTAHAGSDVDVAVRFDAPQGDLLRSAQLAEGIGRALALDPDRIDVRDLDDGTPQFRFFVLRDGRCVHERDHAERIAFETRTMKEYWDLRPMLEAHGQALRERLRRVRA
jgi:uncharacterized protein